MFRKELIPQLKNHPMGLYDIAQLLETSLDSSVIYLKQNTIVYLEIGHLIYGHRLPVSKIQESFNDSNQIRN